MTHSEESTTSYRQCFRSDVKWCDSPQNAEEYVSSVVTFGQRPLPFQRPQSFCTACYGREIVFSFIYRRPHGPLGARRRHRCSRKGWIGLVVQSITKQVR